MLEIGKKYNSKYFACNFEHTIVEFNDCYVVMSHIVDGEAAYSACSVERFKDFYEQI